MVLLTTHGKSVVDGIIKDIRVNMSNYHGKTAGLYLAHGMGVPGQEEYLNITKLLDQLDEITTEKPFKDVKEFYEE